MHVQMHVLSRFISRGRHRLHTLSTESVRGCHALSNAFGSLLIACQAWPGPLSPWLFRIEADKVASLFGGRCQSTLAAVCSLQGGNFKTAAVFKYILYQLIKNNKKLFLTTEWSNRWIIQLVSKDGMAWLGIINSFKGSRKFSGEGGREQGHSSNEDCGAALKMR